MMIEYRWSKEKDAELVLRHGIRFQQVVDALEAGGLIADLEHPQRLRYPHQRMLIVAIDGYAVDVPYVEDRGVRFLKTLFPNRKHTARYLRQ